METTTDDRASRRMTDTLAPTRPPVARSLVAGVLMGLANLVPGVSGGTMILVMGLYERFIGAVARLSSGKPKAMDLVLLGLVGAGAVLAIVPLAGVMSDLVVTRRALMYSLFIGMTLAGTPVLWRMAAPLAKGRAAVLVCLAIGLATMVSLAFLEDPQAREQARELREAEDFRPDASIGRDLAGGGLAMSAMILPGISGAYMLLLLGRYEHVTGAISLLKDAATGGGMADAADALWVLVPIGVGAVLSLVLLSNALKFLLSRYERQMSGLLLGVLWGSTVAIWPFDQTSTGGEIGLGLVAFTLGFGAVLALALWAPKKQSEPAT